MLDYQSHVEDMTSRRPLPPLEERFKFIEDLNEQHFEEFGTFLPSKILYLLGNWCIAEDLANPNPHKASVDERPIISEFQEKRRRRRTVHMDCESTLSTLAFHVKNNSTYRKERANDNE